MAKITGIWRGMALGLVCMTGLAAPLAAQDVTADTVVATVDGKDITLGHMIVLREGLPEQYQALPDETLFTGILEQLIQQQALSQSLEGSLTKRDDLAIENERRGYLSAEAITKVAEAAVTDAALQAAYDARFADAPPTTEWNASHIIVDSEEKAAALKAEIDGGADFAEVAKANSTDGAAANGGSLGWFGPGMMVPEFETAVSAMQPGEVAGPLQTQFGWHLVKLIETRVAEKPTLESVRAELATEIEQKAVEAHITSLTNAATITRTVEGIDPALLRDQTLLGE